MNKIPNRQAICESLMSAAENDRDVISGPYEFTDFNAVFSGHHDVQDYYVVTAMHNKTAGFDTVSRLVNVKAVLYKKSRDDVP